MSDLETKRLDDNLKTQGKLEKSFGKDLDIKDKALLSEGLRNKGGEKEKFDINDLNEGIDSALQDKINRSMGSLGGNTGTKELAEFQKTGLMEDIKKEQDPKKKIEMFQEIVDKINEMEGTSHAEMKKQEKLYSEQAGKEGKEMKDKSDMFSEKLRGLVDMIKDVRIKKLEAEINQKKVARNEGNNEQLKSQKEANEVGERLNMA